MVTLLLDGKPVPVPDEALSLVALALSAVEARDLESVERAVATEVALWKASLPLSEAKDYPLAPAPDTDGGRPAGWVVVGRLPGYQKDTDLVLFRRQHGGWVIARHEHDLERRELFWIDETLADLYINMCEDLADSPAHRRVTLAPAVEWIRGVVTSMFDPADPAEAAEQMLFALSGVLRAAPRAAC